jgi:hypothetical protein
VWKTLGDWKMYVDVVSQFFCELANGILMGSIYGLALFTLPSLPSFRSDPTNFIRLDGVPVFENNMRCVMYSFGFEDPCE